jgi:ABC-type multidrug transport system permease subunit
MACNRDIVTSLHFLPQSMWYLVSFSVSLTSLNLILIKELMVAEQLKIFFVFYRSRIIFESPSIGPILNHISIYKFFMINFSAIFCLRVSLFSRDFRRNVSYLTLLSLMRATYSTLFIFLDLIIVQLQFSNSLVVLALLAKHN